MSGVCLLTISEQLARSSVSHNAQSRDPHYAQAAVIGSSAFSEGACDRKKVYMVENSYDGEDH
jgi:hypothetical protein